MITETEQKQKLQRYLKLVETGFARRNATLNYSLTFSEAKSYHGITNKSDYEAYARGEAGLHRPTHISEYARHMNVSEAEVRETLDRLNALELTQLSIDDHGMIRGIIRG